MVKRLLSGATANGDENSIIKILRASRRAGDFVQLVDQVGAHTLASDIHGGEWATVKSMYKNWYYPHTSQSKAFVLLNTCLVGRTSEWEQEMIADIVCLRSDGRRLITRLGGGEGFKEGLNKLEWNLDWSDQTRVTDMYGSSGKWW